MNTPGISTQDLGVLVEAVTGKEIFQISSHCYVGPMMMLILETRRMSAYRSELVPVLNVLEQVQQMSIHFTRDGFNITEFDEGLFFDILHGKTVTDATMEVLNDFLVESLTALYDEKAMKPLFGPAPIDSYTPEQLAEYRALRVRQLEPRKDDQASSGFWGYVMEHQQAA
ncbi:hypothetical protein D3C84_899570 [compost metagenome]